MGATPAQLDRFIFLRAASLGALLGMVLLPAPGSAQNDLEALLECRRVRDDGERLACYDRALGVPAAQAEDGSSSRDRQAAARRAEPREAAPPQSASLREPATERPAAAPPAARQPPRSNDRREDDDRSAQPVDVMVVEVRHPQVTTAVFVLDNGEVWRQTDGRRTQLDDPPFAAELRGGALGSHFLLPKGRGRAIRVIRDR